VKNTYQPIFIYLLINSSKMRSFLQLAIVSICAIQASALFGMEKASAVTNVPSVFGVSRGGGLFGGSKDEEATVVEKA
jgi:hypothetical protein